MRVGVLITDNGPHPPDAWAQATADQIIDISAQAEETRLHEANQFRDQLLKVLERHHARVQEHERAAIRDQGHARLGQELDATEHVDDPVDEIVALTRAYSFRGHFLKEETQNYLRAVLAKDFASSMLLERSWHADRHANTREAKAFRETHYPGPPPGAAREKGA